MAALFFSEMRYDPRTITNQSVEDPEGIDGERRACDQVTK
jgi:hypothetical protein